MIRVVYDHQVFSWQEYGGISRYYYELARGLSREKGWSAEIVAPLHVNYYLKGARDVRVMGLHIPKPPYSVTAMKALNSALSIPILAVKKPHIVHETFFGAPRLAPRGSRVVLTVYDMIHERLAHLRSTPSPLTRKKAAAVSRADHVICISDHTRKDLQELFHVPDSKVSVIHLGFFHKEEENAGSRSPLDRPYLLYVGDRQWHKNFTALMQAYAASPRLGNDFLLVCFGGGALRDEEKKIIKDLGITDGKVRQLGGEDLLLQRHYRHAAAFVSPSLYEGFGLPLLEAMSNGCPVVCSGVNVYPEIAGNGAHYFDPTDSDSIMRAIEDVVYTPAKRRELIEKGIERLKQFSWEKCVGETKIVYEKLLQ